MSEKIPPRFRKTKSDTWAVMAPLDDLEQALAGDGKIEVLRRSGDWSSFTVKSLGRPFDVDGVKMCYGYADEAGDDSASGDSGGDAGPGASAPQAGGGGRPQGRSRADGGGRPSGRSGPDRGGPLGGRSTVQPPPRDESEPLPEYQGGPEDEWQGF